MSPAPKEKFLGVATVTPQLKMHFPKDVAEAMGLLEGGAIGFYERPSGEIVVKRM